MASSLFSVVNWHISTSMLFDTTTYDDNDYKNNNKLLYLVFANISAWTWYHSDVTNCWSDV